MREGWQQATLADVADVNPRVNGVDESSPFITMADVAEWGRWATSSGVRGSRGGVRARGGDVLVARITPCLENGKIAQVPHDWGPVGGSTEFIVVRAGEEVLPNFVFLWAQNRNTHRAAISKMIGTTGRQRVSAQDYGQLPILVPPLVEQRRIVDLIGAIDDAIEACEDAHASILQIMDRFPAAVTERVMHDGSPITTLGVLLGSPGAVRTGPFGSQLHQSDYVADGPVSVVMPADMQHGRVDLRSAARIRQEDADRLQRHRTVVGDILWSRRGDVTRFAIIDQDSEGVICGTGCFLLRPTMPEDASWLEVLLSAPSVRSWLVSNAVGATMANLNRTILSSIPVPELREEERAEVVEAWSAIRGAERQQRLMAEALRTLRTNALSILLSGEHEIPESYDEEVA